MWTSKCIFHGHTYVMKGEDECQHDPRDKQDYAKNEQHTLAWRHVELDEYMTLYVSAVSFSSTKDMKNNQN